MLGDACGSGLDWRWALCSSWALEIQQRNAQQLPGGEILAFADGDETIVTAHVTHEGEIRPGSYGGSRQSIDVETEEVNASGTTRKIRAGLRLGAYSKEADPEYEEDGVSAPMRPFRYGERLRFPVKLRAPRNFRNPGAFDYRGYLADNGIVVLGSAQAAKIELLPGFVGRHIEQWRERIHQSIVRKIHALWSADDAALMDAAVIGESAFLTPETKTDFQRSGTYHILVVSGMNVSILAFVVFWVMRRLRMGDGVASALTVLLCTAYAFVTDVGPPVWRAVLMLTVYLGVRLLYRERSMLNAVGAAALALMVVDPKVFLGPSFQLTFLAVFLVAAIAVPLLERTSQPYLRGLRYLESRDFDRTLPARVAQMRLDLRLIAEKLERLIDRWERARKLARQLLSWTARGALNVYELLCVSMLMQLGMALPMAYYFHRATVMGIPANALAVPLTELLMPTTVLAVALGYLSVAAAKIPALVAGMARHGITGSVRWLGGFRIADHRVAMPELSTILMAGAALAVAMALVWRRKLACAVGLAALGASGLWISATEPRPQVREHAMEATAIDVGQGDSILVVSPEGKTLLVDAGGAAGGQQSEFDYGENVVSPYSWARGISKIDVVAITHAHSDHIGGMHSVLNNFRPHELGVGALPQSASIDALMNYAARLGIHVVRHSDGEVLELGGMQAEVFSPPASWTASAQAKNNDSLVLRVRYRDSSALLEGDAERVVEQRMIATYDLHADLLKVGHHGSNTSSSQELVNAVHPHWAVISVGAHNPFGHPRMDVLRRLARGRTSRLIERI